MFSPYINMILVVDYVGRLTFDSEYLNLAHHKKKLSLLQHTHLTNFHKKDNTHHTGILSAQMLGGE